MRRVAARGAAGGFTLLELLIALTIMSLAMSVVIASFVATLKGWRKGSELLDGLHHGDFVMEQLVSALRSSAFFVDAPQYYGFWLEDLENGPYPTDAISFVTSGTAFMPISSPLINSMHRIRITVEENDEGDPAVAITAMPHLMDLEEWEGDTWYVSTVVKGLACRVYNMEEEVWEDEWEDTNAIPSLVEISLFMDPLEEGESPVVLSRVVEIPVAPLVENAVRFREEDTEDEQIAREDIEAAEAGAVGGVRGGGGRQRGGGDAAAVGGQRGGGRPRGGGDAGGGGQRGGGRQGGGGEAGDGGVTIGGGGGGRLGIQR